MAGLFMFLVFALGLLGLLGFDIGSQSWLPLLPSLPSEFQLRFHLGFLCFFCFHLSSILDYISDPSASV